MRNAVGEPHITRGHYREVVPSERLAWTWQWDGSDVQTLVTVSFRAIDERTTELTLVHEGFREEESRDQHGAGWRSCLDRLSKEGLRGTD